MMRKRTFLSYDAQAHLEVTPCDHITFPILMQAGKTEKLYELPSFIIPMDFVGAFWRYEAVFDI
jgi:hypothetical protein